MIHFKFTCTAFGVGLKEKWSHQGGFFLHTRRPTWDPLCKILFLFNNPLLFPLREENRVVYRIGAFLSRDMVRNPVKANHSTPTRQTPPPKPSETTKMEKKAGKCTYTHRQYFPCSGKGRKTRVIATYPRIFLPLWIFLHFDESNKKANLLRLNKNRSKGILLPFFSFPNSP